METPLSAQQTQRDQVRTADTIDTDSQSSSRSENTEEEPVNPGPTLMSFITDPTTSAIPRRETPLEWHKRVILKKGSGKPMDQQDTQIPQTQGASSQQMTRDVQTKEQYQQKDQGTQTDTNGIVPYEILQSMTPMIRKINENQVNLKTSWDNMSNSISENFLST
jgi:hypothetical protein